MNRRGTAHDVQHVRQQVIDGAVAEFIVTDFGGFTLEGAAARAGVEVQAVRQMWPNGAELLTEALGEFGARYLPLPDTGTFRGDLLEFARSYAAMINSPMGRRLMNALIAKPEDWDLSVARPTFLDKRDTRMAGVVRRAIDRGECVPDIDPVRIVDLISIGLCLPVTLYDRPITEADSEFVVDALLNGISPRR